MCKRNRAAGASIAIGLAVGVAIGTALNNLGMGIGIGLALGIGWSAAYGRKCSCGEHQDSREA